MHWTLTKSEEELSGNSKYRADLDPGLLEDIGAAQGPSHAHHRVLGRKVAVQVLNPSGYDSFRRRRLGKS